MLSSHGHLNLVGGVQTAAGPEPGRHAPATNCLINVPSHLRSSRSLIRPRTSIITNVPDPEDTSGPLPEEKRAGATCINPVSAHRRHCLASDSLAGIGGQPDRDD